MRLPKGIVRRTIRKSKSVYESRFLNPKLEPHNHVEDTKTHSDAAIEWLCRAQDAVDGGGVARGYSARAGLPFPPGWQPAYPETTGYIIPTFFDVAQHDNRSELRDRASRMALWETEVQLPDGAIPGGVVGEGKGPVVFNTGQVILGWRRAYDETGDSRLLSALTRAGDFLVEAQDPDGAWRRYSTGDGIDAVHAYDVRVSWALLQAWELTKSESYHDAAVRNIEFTLKLLQPNGWFRSNDLQPKSNDTPLTHTIAYATRGIFESGMVLGDDRYVEAAQRTADAVLRLLRPSGFLAGRLNDDWTEAVRWCCLTGSAQMSIIWLKLFRLTADRRYLEAGRRINRYLKTAQSLTSDDEGIRGGIAGPYPFGTGYNRYQVLNWATKFFVDALLLEEALESEWKRSE